MNLSRLIGWFLSGLLALAFLTAGTSKLLGIVNPMFVHWGYKPWFATFIGVLEVLGAVGLLVPRIAFAATLGLTLLMFGAAYTHVANHEGLQLLRPVIFILVLWMAWWLRFGPPKAIAK